MGKKTRIGEVVKSYLDKFSKTPSLTLARKIYKENPLLFTSVESARDRIRYYRGRMGEKHRSYKDGEKAHHSDSPVYYTPPKSLAEDFTPFQLPRGKWGVIADVHLPYHDEAALGAAINYILKKGCTGIIYLGDILDCYSLSKFDKEPDKETIIYEIEVGRKLMKDLGLSIVFKEGNHEDRLNTYIIRKSPELFSLETVKLEYLLKYGVGPEPDDNPISLSFISRKRPIYSQHLTLLHGHEFGRAMTSPVNPARGAFLKATDITIVAHEHRASEHSQTNLRGKLITCWSLGCLCDLHPQYKPIGHQWGHGFGILNTRDNEDWHFENKRIVKGKVL